MIDSVINSINFENVYVYMNSMWMVWSMEDRIWCPTKDEMKVIVRDNIKELCKQAVISWLYIVRNIWWFDYAIDTSFNEKKDKYIIETIRVSFNITDALVERDQFNL